MQEGKLQKFVRSGNIAIDRGSLGDGDNGGWNWSSRTGNNAGAYFLSFYASVVNSSGSLGGYFGFPLRCLAS